jgi:L,D-transpeptidase catalytic domain/D-alanyl-D-alanine carboxypeptidase
MFGKLSLTIAVFVSSFLLAFGAIFFVRTTTFAQSYPFLDDEPSSSISLPKETPITGRHVVALLNGMKIELRDGTTTLASYPIISKGKPGSYYETIGGNYPNDYKTPLHFSSIGHVYMPYSVHVFGNYFIHGIPYYPNGDKVSSTYSGGCLRLSDEDAQTVYDFIQKGTPIIMSQVAASEFSPVPVSSSTLVFNSDITRLMVATVSLEALTQDNVINKGDEEEMTRRDLLPLLIKKGVAHVATTYAQSVGEKAFIEMMNQKARALGMTNTVFDSVTDSAQTSTGDIARFFSYINNYKSYIRTIENATSTP